MKKRATVNHIKDLRPDPANRRKHNPRNIGMVVDALHQVGAARSVVIDEDNVILAGNGVTEAAAEAGITRVQVVDVDGSTLVAVRRRGLSDEQKRALAIYDNRTAELAEWNAEQLQADLDAGLSLEPWFSEQEQAAIMAKAGIVKPGLTDPDEVPPERPTSIQRGDLFELGRHRLLCGDSTSGSDWERLMTLRAQVAVTSPPYASQRRYGLGEFDWDAVVPTAIFGASKVVTDDGSLLVNLGLIHQNGRVVEYWRPLLDAMETVRPLYGWYVWDKLNGMPGDHHGRLAMSHEWVFHFATSPRRARKTTECKLAGEVTHQPGRRSGLRGQDDIVQGWGHAGIATQSHKVPDSVIRCHPAKGGAEGHPAPFSVAFASELIAAYTNDDEIAYEPFSGSGTTLIACEQLNRRCFAIEIEPSYCQIAIDRWEAFSGGKAVRVA